MHRYRRSILAAICLLFPALASAPQALDGDALDAWVGRVEQTLVTGQFDARVMDQSAFIQETLRPFNLERAEIQPFEQFDIVETLINNLTALSNEPIGCRFLRIREVDGVPMALFRITSESGLNYFEWSLKQTAEGDVIAFDLEPYASGEPLSLTLRRLWTPAVAQMAPRIEPHIGKRARVFAEHLEEVGGMRVAIGQGDYARCAQIYEALPQTVQEELAVMLLVSQAYFMLDDMDAYVQTLERYHELHGNESNAELILLDVRFMQEDYRGVVKLVDALDERIGGDPYLDLFRANVAYLEGDYAGAKTLIDRGLAEDAAMLDLMWAAIEQAEAEQDWPRISAMLTALERQGVELENLDEIPFYENYVQTDAYRKWLARRGPVLEE